MAYTTIEGTVSRINSRGTGFGVKETWQEKGEEKFRYWSVFLPDGVERTVVEGQTVKVSGGLRTRVSERDARFVDHTLNQAKVLETAAPVVAAPAAADTWAPATNYGDETPF